MLKKLMNKIFGNNNIKPRDLYGTVESKVESSKSSDSLEGGKPMQFTVFSATGGKVIQFSSYDRVTDRAVRNLYIVTDTEQLGEELAQIIMRESLSR